MSSQNWAENDAVASPRNKRRELLVPPPFRELDRHSALSETGNENDRQATEQKTQRWKVPVSVRVK